MRAAVRAVAIRPGRRMPAVLGAIALGAFGSVAFPEIAWSLPVLLGAVLVLAAAEWTLLRRVGMALERPDAVALMLDESETVRMQLSASGEHAIDVVVRQPWPRLVDRGSSTARGRCLPGRPLELEVSARAVERGEADLEPPHVAASAWGLVERIAQVGEPSRLSVLPNLRALGRVDEELRQMALRGQGARLAPRLGRGREFARLREYVEGDDLRDVAWKASARHRKLITREFQVERAQDVLLCLDRGHRMAARVGRLTRLDHAVNASLLVAHACRKLEDRVGMLSFAADVDEQVPVGRGAAHSRQLVHLATRVRADYVHSDHLALAARLRKSLRHRTLVLVMTEIPEGDESEGLLRAMRMLLPQHLPLVLVLSDPELEAGARILPSDRAELCRTLVARETWTRRQALIRHLRQIGALVVETTPSNAGLAAVNGYIDVKRRQLL